MALVLRRLGRVEVARSYLRDIRNNNDYFHFTVGRTTAWADDASPETPIDSDDYTKTYRRSMMFSQLLTSADACLLAKRIDWDSTGNTVYDEYDDAISTSNKTNSGASTLADSTMVIVTDEYKVYKCINNNNNSKSVNKPTSTGTAVFSLDDGYQWKFLFQISASDQTKFLDNDYIPVRKLTGNPTHDVTGEVDTITVDTAGSGYDSTPTVVISGDGTGAGATATMAGSGGSQTVSSISVTTAGTGYSFALASFVGGTPSTEATATVNLGDADSLPALQSAVESAATDGTVDRIKVTAAGVNYASGDVQISISGDGSGAEATATVADGAITGVTVTTPGSGYTYADVTFTNTAASGTGATARAIISPQGGHGSNPTKECFASNLGLVTSLSDNANKDLILGNDYRQIALVKNLRNPSDVIYTSGTGTICYIINVADESQYAADDIITTDDGGSFQVAQVDTANKNIYLIAKIPLITASSTLTNSTKSLTSLSINSVTSPEVKNTSGEIVYLDNRTPITRSEDQVETLKAIIRF